MICVRTATLADGPALRRLLDDGGFTHTSAPLASDAPAGAALVLVAEDLRNSQLLATARLAPAIGLHLPRYAYHVGVAVHASPELRLFHRQRTLLLCNDHTGASELADVAAAGADLPLADRAAALALVVQTALLRLAQHRRQHADQLIVALPGVRDGAGQSPFWQGLGQAFSNGDPLEAAREHGSGWKSHVAALMPRHPVYASFLPAAAQAAVAQPHAGTQPLLDVLEHEGLRYSHHIDIYDGGPILEARPDDLHSVAASRVWPVRVVDVLAADARSHAVMTLAEPLRAARLRCAHDATHLLVARDDAHALGLHDDSRVRAVPTQTPDATPWA